MYSDHEETNWPKRIFIILFFLGLIGGLVSLGYLYYQTRQELKFLASPAGQEELGRRATQQTVEALAQLAILPQEDPVIATITDKDALASQSAFYRNAENGDKLVVFPQAQQAYIYSPSKNKIVNVGPLVIESEDQPSGIQAEESEPAVRPTPAPTPIPQTESAE